MNDLDKLLDGLASRFAEGAPSDKWTQGDVVHLIYMPLRDALVRLRQEQSLALNLAADAEEREAALREALDRISKAHAPAAHLQEIARAALAGKDSRE